MSINWSKVKSGTIYVLGLAGVVIGAIPQVDVPDGVHTALVAVGGVILAIEQYLQGQLQIAAVNNAAHEALVQAETHSVYIGAGVLIPDEVRKMVFALEPIKLPDIEVPMPVVEKPVAARQVPVKRTPAKRPARRGGAH